MATGHQPSSRRHEFRIDYFDRISPASAYVLGLLMSDGCITEAPKSKGSKVKVPTAVMFCSKDFGLVQYVKDEFQATYPITEPKVGFFRFTISNRRFAAELARFGLIPRKNTGLTTYPDIPSQFDRDFIRGVFDRDGYVRVFNQGQSKRTGKIWQSINMGWSGSRALLSAIRERLTKDLDLPTRPLYPKYNGFTFDLVYSSKYDCLRIFRSLYLPDCCMKLERKYTKAERFFEERGLL